jgi:hypothetical protein
MEDTLDICTMLSQLPPQSGASSCAEKQICLRNARSQTAPQKKHPAYEIRMDEAMAGRRSLVLLNSVSTKVSISNLSAVYLFESVSGNSKLRLKNQYAPAEI